MDSEDVEVPVIAPKKRTLSPEALEKLQAARVKALEVRRAKKLKYDAGVLAQIKEDKEKVKDPLPKKAVGRPKKEKEIKKTSARETEDEASDTDFHNFPKKSKPKKLRKQTKIIIDNDSESDSDDDEPAIIIKTKKKKKKATITPVPQAESNEPVEPRIDAPMPELNEPVPQSVPLPPPRQPAWMSFR